MDNAILRMYSPSPAFSSSVGIPIVNEFTERFPDTR